MSLLIITSCSTTPSVWETTGGVKASNELLIAAKEACDYDKKHAEVTAYEREYRDLFRLSAQDNWGGDHISDELELRAIDLQKTIGELKNEMSECMRQQDLVQRTAISNT